jgi:hypothetical protein
MTASAGARADTLWATAHGAEGPELPLLCALVLLWLLLFVIMVGALEIAIEE